ncbi:hypothetical protein QE152_g1983 [Popillia japonica]|uniref:Uncharacterized protein n=1 Tax=Popillia japonica TaxID=7064 RepID=A0AAW1N0A2_POPJA
MLEMEKQAKCLTKLAADNSSQNNRGAQAGVCEEELLTLEDIYNFYEMNSLPIFNNRIVDPFFFRGTLNAGRYLQFLRNEFFAALEDFTLEERLKIQEERFQQDGALQYLGG